MARHGPRGLARAVVGRTCPDDVDGRMQFLTFSRRPTDTFAKADFAALVDAEIGQARVLYAEGFLRQIWHRADVSGACMLIEADSAEQVREKLRTLPLVGAGMLEVTSVPLRPYADFAPAGAPKERPGVTA